MLTSGVVCPSVMLWYCVQAAKCRLVKILSPSASITFPVGSTELHTEIPQDHTQPGDFGYKNHEVILG